MPISEQEMASVEATKRFVADSVADLKADLKADLATVMVFTWVVEGAHKHPDFEFFIRRQGRL